MQTLLQVLERYYDAAPRSTATVEDFGPLTLFIAAPGGFPYYARPTLGHPGPVRVSTVQDVLSRMDELDLPHSVEWVQETTPWLAQPLTEVGLSTRAHPLLVLDRAVGPAPPDTRILDAADPLLARAVALAQLAFECPGTARGAAGFNELDAATAALADGTWVARTRDRILAGRTVLAAAFDGENLVASGQHNPVGATTELVGVATLPAARRRGAGLAVTNALVAEAVQRGVLTVFLSAGDDDVARVYRRAGFRDVGTAMIAND